MFRTGPKDPTKRPPSSTNILGMVIYSLLILLSALASGASLSSTFNLPAILGFALGVAFALIASMLLISLQRALANHKGLWVIFSGLMFITVLGISLLTNTHSIFMLANLDDIRKDEMQLAANELNIIVKGAGDIFDDDKEEFITNVNQDAEQLRKQILAVGNCGVGPNSQQLITKLGGYFGKTITPQREPRSGSRCPQAYVPIADAYVKTVMDLLAAEVAKRDDDKKRLLRDLDAEKADTLRTKLLEIQRDYEEYSERDVERSLKEAYGDIDRQYDLIKNQSKLNEIETNDLPPVPESIELKRISGLPGYIANNGGYRASGVIYSFIIALILDLGAFIVFWRFVLYKEEDQY